MDGPPSIDFPSALNRSTAPRVGQDHRCRKSDYATIIKLVFNSCISTVEQMKLCVLFSGGFVALLILSVAAAQPLGESSATTETTCNFGMAKNEKRQSCHIPIPSGCVVANFPGTTKPWTNISKGGLTMCRFNDKETDWKTRITGTCSKCGTSHCSARFAVVFDCSAVLPPPTTHVPMPHP